MSCMRCYVMLKTFSCFLSEFKCSRLLDPSSFTSSHPEVSQCYRTPSPKALDISPVHMFLCKIKEKKCVVNAFVVQSSVDCVDRWIVR